MAEEKRMRRGAGHCGALTIQCPTQEGEKNEHKRLD